MQSLTKDLIIFFNSDWQTISALLIVFFAITYLGWKFFWPYKSPSNCGGCGQCQLAAEKPSLQLIQIAQKK